jgi:hypothetical protein
LEPAFAQSCGGTLISLFGRGIYDSQIKKLKFRSIADPSGEREIAAEWDKKRKCLQFRLPPLRWLWGEAGENMEDERLAEIMAQPCSVYLTYNNQEWIEGPTFEYHDFEVSRLKYAHGDMSPEESGADSPVWDAEVPIEEPPEDLNEEQLAKYQEDM